IRNSWYSLISGASCGSLAARVSIARRRSNGGRRNSLVTVWLQIGKLCRRLAVLFDAAAAEKCSVRMVEERSASGRRTQEGNCKLAQRWGGYRSEERRVGEEGRSRWAADH